MLLQYEDYVETMKDQFVMMQKASDQWININVVVVVKIFIESSAQLITKWEDQRTNSNKKIERSEFEAVKQ